MPTLPIRRMILYKHGVGYFERRGEVEGAELRLSFPRAAMDDVLKSLIALDLGQGQVHGVDFETPEDRAAQIARGSIHLSDHRSLLDLLRDLRGRRVRLHTGEEPPDAKKGFGLNAARRSPAEPAPEQPAEPAAPPRTQIEGLVIGVDVEDAEQLRHPLVSVYQPEQRQVRAVPVRDVRRLEVLDDRSAADLSYFLRAAQSEEDRRAATLRLSAGAHDLLVGYIAPAPAWRVSYRLLFENEELRMKNEESPENASSSILNSQFSILLQGWGLFDNQLDEDLEDVALTLVAGMPVSFRYRLYEPHTPERPLVADEERTVTAPIEFTAAAPPAPAMAAPMAMKRGRPMTLGAAEAMADSAVSIEAAASSTMPVSVGEERGALFQYRVGHPVSVARGQSAMVPIVGQRLGGRKELLYNGAKLPKHPVASLRLRNETGLTLERGPVTVIEAGDYAGEAVLPFTRAGGELIVPYAVELGISIAEEHSGERQTSGLRVRDEYLIVQEWDIQITRYHIHSTLSAPAEVTVEQAMIANYTIFDTPEPLEHTQGTARWLVACPPGATTSFTVRQRSETSRWEQLRGVSGQQLREYLKGRYLDEPTYQGLSEVLATYEQIDAHRRRLEEIERERKAAYKQQQQIQGSLAPLGREGDEGALRTRYVATLGGLEDRLAALAAEEQRLNAEIARIEADAKRRLAELTGK